MKVKFTFYFFLLVALCKKYPEKKGYFLSKTTQLVALNISILLKHGRQKRCHCFI